jgi:hypothetical protein
MGETAILKVGRFDKQLALQYRNTARVIRKGVKKRPNRKQIQSPLAVKKKRQTKKLVFLE